jgi:hypothetical protein
MPSDKRRRRPPGEGPPRATGHDPTSAVFDQAADTLDQAAADARTEAGRIRHLRRQRARGRAWRDVLGAGVARSLLEELAMTGGQMTSVGGRLRRAIVAALLGEGQRVKQIADSLGVSHQRVSRVLGQSAEDDAAAHS